MWQHLHLFFCVGETPVSPVMNRNARPATKGETANVMLLDHPRNLYEHVTNDSCPPGMLHLLARASIASGHHKKTYDLDSETEVATIPFRKKHTHKEQKVLTRSLKIKYDKVGCLHKSWRGYIYSCSPQG